MYWKDQKPVSSEELAAERFETLGLSRAERELMRASGIGRVATGEWVGSLRQRFSENMPSGFSVYLRHFPSVTYAPGQVLAASPNYNILRNDRGNADPALSVNAFLDDMYEQEQLGPLSRQSMPVPFLGKIMLTPVRSRTLLIAAHLGDYYPEDDTENPISDGLLESERLVIEKAVEEEGAEEAREEEQKLLAKHDRLDDSLAEPEGIETDEDTEYYQQERTRHKLHLGVLRITTDRKINPYRRKANEIIRNHIEKKLESEVMLRPVGIAPVSGGKFKRF